MPDRPVIANNTPLVALWVLDRFDILRDLYGQVLIPEAVHTEFLATEPTARQKSLDTASWIKVTPLNNRKHLLAYTGLDQGETEVLALAEEQNARLVIIDENRGRRYANRLGLPLTGTIGVLLLAKEQKLIGSVGPLLAQLAEAGLFLSPSLVAKALQMANERAP